MDGPGCLTGAAWARLRHRKCGYRASVDRNRCAQVGPGVGRRRRPGGREGVCAPGDCVGARPGGLRAGRDASHRCLLARASETATVGGSSGAAAALRDAPEECVRAGASYRTHLLGRIWLGRIWLGRIWLGRIRCDASVYAGITGTAGGTGEWELPSRECPLSTYEREMPGQRAAARSSDRLYDASGRRGGHLHFLGRAGPLRGAGSPNEPPGNPG
jgi:hypothetical protein